MQQRSIRILNIEPLGYSEDARRILRSVGEVVERESTPEDLSSDIRGFDVLIVRLAYTIDRAVLDAAKDLKVIVSATTGLDHIDVQHAQELGVEVLSLRDDPEAISGIAATAELTWGLLLALVRKIPGAVSSTRRSEWRRDEFRGRELRGSRLGIVGMGRLGKRVSNYGLSFEMTCHGFDPYVPQEGWPMQVRKEESLDGLLRNSDIVSLHVPLTEETRGLIGRDELAQVPPGSLLINTSRGEILDEEALLEALRRGHLAGAALDVVQDERNIRELAHRPLFQYAAENANLIITPHIGGATSEAMEATEVLMATKLADFLKTSRVQ